MKNYKVKITRNFFDNEEKVDRVLETDTEEFLCTKERYEFLKSKNCAVELVEVVDDEVSEEVVQAVASAIVEEAEENDKSVEEVVNEIVEEQKDEEEREKILAGALEQAKMLLEKNKKAELTNEAEEKAKKRTNKK